jgi:hypothetical protein
VESNRDDAALQAPPALSSDLANMTTLKAYGPSCDTVVERGNSGTGGADPMSRDSHRTNKFATCNNIKKELSTFRVICAVTHFFIDLVI